MDFKEELENMKRRLKTQEDLRLNLMNEKDRLELEIKHLKESHVLEMKELEKENENMRKKMNSSFNSAIIQNNQMMSGRSGKLDDE